MIGEFSRTFRASICALAAFAGCSAALAQSYPSKPVRILVPYAPGGPYDDIARVIAQNLGELWGQAVVVDNRGGAGGMIGAEAVAKSSPDGYTLLLGNSGPMTINPTLQPKMLYDAQKDFAPVTMVLSGQMVLVVHPSLPVKNVRELVRLAKAKPGQLNYASAGVGNLQHLGMELLQSLAGIKLNHVPYKGAAPAFIDLIAGQVDLMFANIVGALPHLKSGRVRALAVSSAKRAAVLPEVPSVAESGYPTFDATTWTGIFAPAATPKEIIAKLHGDIIKVLQRQSVRDRFAAQGSEVVAETPEQLAAFMRKETALFAKVIRSANIRAE
jgi:tripartite-type tricarboxylate transporter receptor subunit TctC